MESHRPDEPKQGQTVDPGILLVLDGWGIANPGPGNAIACANTPVMDDLMATCPTALLEASGAAVGLPPDTAGNSEVGHLVLAAGRAVEYESTAVRRLAECGALRSHPDLLRTCTRLRDEHGALHLVGLCSDGQIHSDISYYRELLAAASSVGLRRVWIHAITDGRDVADGTAAGYLEQLQEMAMSIGVGRFASVIGRAYAMDKSGDRQLTEAAYDAIVAGEGTLVSSHQEAIEQARAASVPDQWIAPSVVADAFGHVVGRVAEGDALLFTNFRSDRMQQLALLVLERCGKRRLSGPTLEILSLTQYDAGSSMLSLVPRADASGGLADALEAARIKSVRIAESEKFEHVTFFFNGRDPRRRPFEEHVSVPNRAKGEHAKFPAMNVDGVAAEVCAAARRPDVGLVVANLANVDVVGHTADLSATVLAAEAVDSAVGEVCRTAGQEGRWVVVVGDHGNAEQMLEPDTDGATRPYGGHTTNPVPFVLIHPDGRDVAPRGAIASVGPTIQRLLRLANAAGPRPVNAPKQPHPLLV